MTALGGPAPQVIANWYEEHGAINHDAMDAAIAPIAGYFTDAPPRPGIAKGERIPAGAAKGDAHLGGGQV